ncbi:MAG: NADH-quinone oxidoreductase subunit N [Armatimonadota bacterium]|nr:NADH-quinone oxidoreductase subunit N [Armatimonadota bacterium]MDR5697042.1 NADH-quinone oxidoreductase subunit N [Armatimonadota bacterium]
MIELRPLLPELIVAGTAIVVLFADLPLRGARSRVALVWLCLVGLGAAGVAIGAVRQEAVVVFGGMYLRDGLADLAQTVILVAAALAVLLARDYLVRTGLERGEYYALALFAALGAMLMAATRDLLMLFVAVEILSVPLYILAAFARPQRRSQEAGLKYFLLGSFAAALFLYGLAMIYGAAGTTDLIALADVAPGWMLSLGLGLVLVGLAFKVAAVPFHVWAPDVYEGSPMPAAAYMSVVAKVGAVAAMLRVLPLSLPALADLWQPLTAAIAAATMAVANLAALRQTSVKRMLAYSSVAHAGYVLIGVASGTPDGGWAAVYYLLVYTFMQLGAFGVLLLLERAGAEADEIADLHGLGDRAPALAAAFALFMASLTGLPPTAGFLAKFYLFAAAIDAGYMWLAIVGVVTSVVSVGYYLRAAYAAYTGEARATVRTLRGSWTAAGVALAAGAVVLLGVLPGPMTAWAVQLTTVFGGR